MTFFPEDSFRNVRYHFIQDNTLTVYTDTKNVHVFYRIDDKAIEKKKSILCVCVCIFFFQDGVLLILKQNKIL